MSGPTGEKSRAILRSNMPMPLVRSMKLGVESKTSTSSWTSERSWWMVVSVESFCSAKMSRRTPPITLRP